MQHQKLDFATLFRFAAPKDWCRMLAAQHLSIGALKLVVAMFVAYSAEHYLLIQLLRAETEMFFCLAEVPEE